MSKFYYLDKPADLHSCLENNATTNQLQKAKNPHILHLAPGT